MPKNTSRSTDGRITLADGNWIEITDGLMEMPMEDMASWVDAERDGRLRDVWPFMAQAMSAWSWEQDPHTPDAFAKRTLREYRLISQAITKAMQDIAKN